MQNVVSSVIYDVRSEFCSKDKYHNWLYGKPWIDIDSSTSSTPILPPTSESNQEHRGSDCLNHLLCGDVAVLPLHCLLGHSYTAVLYTTLDSANNETSAFISTFPQAPGGNSLHEALFAKCIIFAVLEVYFLLHCEQDTIPYKRHIKSGASRAQ